MKYILWYFAAISLWSVAVCIFDKRRAKKHGRRVPERTLLFLCALGGSLAMYITMRLIRHKTRHKKFMIGIPVIMVLQAAVICGWIYLMKSDLTFLPR